MNRVLVGFLMFALSSVLFTHEGFAQGKQVITFAYTDDAAYEPYVYAIRQGIVSSKMVEVKLLPTAIPALLQSTGTKQFDLIETSPLLLANANLRGLDARIVGTGGIVRGGRYVFVQNDSPIKKPADLKGKTMGATAIASTLVAQIRAVLTKQFGLNTSLENGDIRWVELPLPTLASALERNQVDSIYLIHIPSLRALQSGKFRILVDMTKDFRHDFGVDPLTSVIATYDSKIAEKGPALHEAIAMLRASAAYAKSHQAEVFAAVAKEKNMDIKDLNTVSYKWYELRFTLSGDDQKMIKTILDIGKEQGLIPGYPTLDKFIWQ